MLEATLILQVEFNLNQALECQELLVQECYQVNITNIEEEILITEEEIEEAEVAKEVVKEEVTCQDNKCKDPLCNQVLAIISTKAIHNKCHNLMELFLKVSINQWESHNKYKFHYYHFLKLISINCKQSKIPMRKSNSLVTLCILRLKLLSAKGSPVRLLVCFLMRT